MRFLRHPLLHRAIALVLGGVFLYASMDKIEKPAEFARIVYHYQIVGPNAVVGPWLANGIAVTLPWIEAVAGALLVFGKWRREAALAVALLLLVFLGAVGSALYRRIDIENCGCFSVSGKGRSAGAMLLAGDALLLLGALVLVSCPPRLMPEKASA